MKGIHFSHADRKSGLRRAADHKAWLGSVLSAELPDRVFSIRYIFCSDAFLLSINQEFLQHDDLTDIITFDLSDSNSDGVVAEIYISSERVTDNALVLGLPYEEELRRVMVHGLLHLCGHGDKTKREKEQMRLRESHYLRLWV
jgi:probable rRNA maturation factor